MSVSDLKYFKEFKKYLDESSMDALLYLDEKGWSAPTILTEREVAQLKWVATTKNEAETILTRNSQLLENVLNDDHEYSDFGCPHCEHTVRYGYLCDGCAWSAIYGDCYTHPCLEQPFSGIRMSDSGIDYCSNCERYKGLDFSEDAVDKRESILFLAGHVEWAIMMLEGVFTTLRKTPYRKRSASARYQWNAKAHKHLPSSEDQLITDRRISRGV